MSDTTNTPRTDDPHILVGIDSGIAYVANFYSRGYARSVYRSLVADAQEFAA